MRQSREGQSETWGWPKQWPAPQTSLLTGSSWIFALLKIMPRECHLFVSTVSLWFVDVLWFVSAEACFLVVLPHGSSWAETSERHRDKQRLCHVLASLHLSCWQQALYPSHLASPQSNRLDIDRNVAVRRHGLWMRLNMHPHTIQ